MYTLHSMLLRIGLICPYQEEKINVILCHERISNYFLMFLTRDRLRLSNCICIHKEIRSAVDIPVEHSSPMNPGAHVQVNMLSPSVQVAPFMQRLLAHSSTSTQEGEVLTEHLQREIARRE